MKCEVREVEKLLKEIVKELNLIRKSLEKISKN